MNIVKTIKKLHRKCQLALLDKADPVKITRLGEKKLLRLFRKASNASPALKNILQAHRISCKDILTIEAFSALDFTMSKENTFNEYALADLCRKDTLNNLKGVLTSSGHSGNFAYGLTTWQQGKNTPDALDLALQAVFQIDEKKTLLVNCLPMGVRFPTNMVTQAEVSVREDMALTLINKFSPYYDQVIIVCDPLFLKLLMDEGETWQVNWQKFHKNLIIGEETFGENYRDYVGQKLNINPDDPATGIIGSSMGVGELGLNLCFETLETIALRRTISRNPVLMTKLFGCDSEYDPLPMLFAYNPLSYYLEAQNNDNNGYGELLVSILDKDCPIPLFRYQTGDEAKLMNNQEIISAFQEAGLPTPNLPNMPLICIRGRQKDRLPTGMHIGVIKDALYKNIEFADRITGAFRIDRNIPDQLHVQLRRGENPENIDTNDLCVKKVKLWKYDDFPYGKTIDYERKFSYLS